MRNITDETRLLAEIIRHCPDGSTWYISTDSYTGIKYILEGFVSVTQGDWVVKIEEGNKNDIAQLVEKNGLALKAIHMTIESKDQTILFRSYDAMCTIIINKDFYRELDTTNGSSELDILLN